MKIEIRERDIKNVSKARERAAMLSNSIRQLKNLGIVVTPNAPIEGKMFW